MNCRSRGVLDHNTDAPFHCSAELDAPATLNDSNEMDEPICTFSPICVSSELSIKRVHEHAMESPLRNAQTWYLCVDTVYDDAHSIRRHSLFCWYAQFYYVNNQLRDTPQTKHRSCPES
ncbi:hypothetical protein Tco_0216069 [Tanacetum coccineum]